MLFSDKELREILLSEDQDFLEELYRNARETAKATFSNKIYIRALIEFSNYCKEGCYYCGINRNKSSVHRFRLSKEEIYSAAETAYEAGFRTFVLQGGEDTHFTDEAFSEIISYLKKNYDAAITLSLGVRSYEAYKLFKKAGADRFLLRHETADREIFQKLHPWDQSLERRLKAIYDLKALGYQVGTGFMVAAPFTNHESHIKDIKLIREIDPAMIGIGPFIPSKGTRFEAYPAGTVELTRKLLAILRIEHPKALIPSTTALNTISETGRIKGILSGANVIMPNVSPKFARDNYNLYDGKRASGLEAIEGVRELNEYLKEFGYEIEFTRGDYNV